MSSEKPNKVVHYIPPLPPKRKKKVGIYCRVSTNSMDQLRSLAVQVSVLTRLVAATQKWLLIDVYMDVASGKEGSSRKEFVRMLEDCKGHKVDMVLTKNISRFGRDTVVVLNALKAIKEFGVHVLFQEENLDTANTDNDLMVTIIEAIAQAENEARSRNIRWGIEQHAADGTSKLYNRPCYGYRQNEEGVLVVDKDEAAVIELIFWRYLQGDTSIGIVRELGRRNIKSPKGKDKWRTLGALPTSFNKIKGLWPILHMM